MISDVLMEDFLCNNIEMARRSECGLHDEDWRRCLLDESLWSWLRRKQKRRVRSDRL